MKWMKTFLIFCLLGISLAGMPAWAQTEFLGDEEEPQPAQPPAPAPPPPPAPEAPPAPQQPAADAQQGVVDVLLLMDVSGSMEAFALDQNMDKLEAAKQALSYVVQNMTDAARFQLWTFSASIKQYPIPTGTGEKMRRGKFESVGGRNSQTRQALLDIVRGIEIPSDANVTNLYLAIRQALQYYASASYNEPQSGEPATQLIVVLSDGKDDKFSPVTLGDVAIAKGRFPQIEIKTIGFGIQPNSPLARELCYIATNNQCALAQDSQQLQKVLQSFTNF